MGSGAPEILQRAPGEHLPDFGQPHAGEAHALPLRVGGKTVAVLVAERSSGESPCVPAALRLLVTVARISRRWRRKRQSIRNSTAANVAPVSAATPYRTVIKEDIEQRRVTGRWRKEQL